MAATGEWAPDRDTINNANLTDFMRWLAEHGRGEFSDYPSLWHASVTDADWFWRAVWDYFGVGGAPAPKFALGDATMPGAQWFPGTTVNYAAEVFRRSHSDRPAMIVVGEEHATPWSWQRLHDENAAFAAYLRQLGVQPGDRVVGYLPNIGETVAAFLGAAAVGAIWAVCNPDVSPAGVIDRLGQLEPAVLVAADSSVYGGKTHHREQQITEIASALPSLKATVLVSRTDTAPGPHRSSWAQIIATPTQLVTVPLPFDHPLWVLFSSGTTGRPKGIMHGHGGVVLEHLKYLSLQLDLHHGDRFLWYSTTSWMMWNLAVSGLLAGATIVLYDGSPTYPDVDKLWHVVAEHHVNFLGAGAGYFLSCAKALPSSGDIHPGLTALRAVGSTGSPLPASGFRWIQEFVGRDIPVVSMCGGTDVVTAFLGGCPLMPIRPGELNAICLGAAISAWDHDQTPVLGAPGELVLTAPMPSMPVGFWNDDDGQRYRQAYFDTYPGVWRHGDWITINESGSVVVHGRSDATLNRNGVRMGSGEIYNALEGVAEIRDSLVIGLEQSDGGYWMPLFIALAENNTYDDDLREKIVRAIRAGASPRHVPDDIIVVPGLPRTTTGKRLEIPVKRVLLGSDPAVVINPASVDRPDLFAVFSNHRRAGAVSRL